MMLHATLTALTALIAIACSGQQALQAKDLTAAELATHDADALAAIERGLQFAQSRPGARKVMECGRTAGVPWPGLTLTAGTVTGADILSEIGGFAKSAGVTGGLGGALKVVTSAADYLPDGKQPPIPGSLRATIEELAKTKAPGWVVFGPELGAGTKITLTAPLRLPDNVALDGRCADVTVEAKSKIGLIYIFGKRNIIVAHLAFRKSDYAAGLPDDAIESCIRLNAGFDAIAILHNDLERCGDGVIDSTISPKMPIPGAARVTVAYNFVRDHDKTMLFGTFGCVEGSEKFAQGCVPPQSDGPAALPALYLSLEGNVFLRTGQRHPRVYGRVMAHIANNVIVFEQQRKSADTDAKPAFGAGYGTLVTNGARALIERNVYVSVGRNAHPSAAWTTTSPGAARMPEDVPGAIRLADNLTTARELIADNAPGTVPDPIYRNTWTSPPLAGRSIEQAVACVAARAGRGGANQWPARLCAAH